MVGWLLIGLVAYLLAGLISSLLEAGLADDADVDLEDLALGLFVWPVLLGVKLAGRWRRPREDR